MTRKRHKKLMRAFVSRVNEFAHSKGLPTSHGKAMYYCTTDEMTKRPLEWDGRPITREEFWHGLRDTVTLFGLSFKGVTK